MQDKLTSIAHAIKLGDKSSQRIRDNWIPLQAIAQHFKDTEWLDYSNKEIEASIRSFRGSQKYDPEQALLLVVKEKMFTVVIGKEKVLTNSSSPMS